MREPRHQCTSIKICARLRAFDIHGRIVARPKPEADRAFLLNRAKRRERKIAAGRMIEVRGGNAGGAWPHEGPAAFFIPIWASTIRARWRKIQTKCDHNPAKNL